MKYKKFKIVLLFIGINSLAYDKNYDKNDLFMAVHCGDIDLIKKCSESGVSIDSYDANHNTPIMIAIKNLTSSPDKQKEIVNFLINAKCDLKIKNSFDETPLFLAIYTGSHEIVQLLIDAGAHKETSSKILAQAYEKGVNGPYGSGSHEKFKSIKKILRGAISHMRAEVLRTRQEAYAMKNERAKG